MRMLKQIFQVITIVGMTWMLTGCSATASIGATPPHRAEEKVWCYTILQALESPNGGVVLLVWAFAIATLLAYVSGRCDDTYGDYHIIRSHNDHKWYSWTDYSKIYTIPNGSKSRGHRYVAYIGLAIVFCFAMYFVVNTFHMTNMLEWVIGAVVVATGLYFIRPIVQPIFMLLAWISWAAVAVDFVVGLVIGLSVIKLP